MTPRPLFAIPLAFVLWPAAGAEAQEGPSFDCSYAGTRTEIAICSSPDLAALERQMVASYERLAETIGRREARALADELLARRQACEGDPNCIAERLLISTEIFEQRGAPRGRVAELVPSIPLPNRDGDISGLVPVVPPPAPEPEPEAQIASAEPVPVPEIPLAAQAPLPPESVPLPPSRRVETQLASAQGLPEAEAAVSREDLPLADLPAVEENPDLSDAIDGAELASSDGATPEAGAGDDTEASFDSPVSWTFMDLPREERTAIQERLTGAGYFEGEASGAWTTATEAALERFAAEEGSDSFDLTTQTGAALLLDYIRSDAFATAFGSEQASLDAAAPQPPRPVEDAIDSTDW